MYKLRVDGYNHRFWNSQYIYKAKFDFYKKLPLYAYSGKNIRIGKMGKIKYFIPHIYSGGFY